MSEFVVQPVFFCGQAVVKGVRAAWLQTLVAIAGFACHEFGVGKNMNVCVG
jgi:hypothetical protein